MRNTTLAANWLLNDMFDNINESEITNIKSVNKIWEIKSDYDLNNGKISINDIDKLISEISKSLKKAGSSNIKVENKSTSEKIHLIIKLTIDSPKIFIKSLDSIDSIFTFVDGGHDVSVDDITSGKKIPLDGQDIIRFLVDNGSDISDKVCSSNKLVMKLFNGTKVINEAKEAEDLGDTSDEGGDEEEDEIDVDKALKIVTKIEKLAAKSEDEKLGKLVADLKKALGVDDEAGEKESEEDVDELDKM